MSKNIRPPTNTTKRFEVISKIRSIITEAIPLGKSTSYCSLSEEARNNSFTKGNIGTKNQREKPARYAFQTSGNGMLHLCFLRIKYHRRAPTKRDPRVRRKTTKACKREKARRESHASSHPTPEIKKPKSAPPANNAPKNKSSR